MRDALRPESYPLLMDFEMDAVNPAADGRPWRKACAECLFRRRDPQDVGESYRRIIRLSNPEREGLFYCTHRTDAGEHRVCACYAACRDGEGVPMPRRPATPTEPTPTSTLAAGEGGRRG